MSPSCRDAHCASALLLLLPALQPLLRRSATSLGFVELLSRSPSSPSLSIAPILQSFVASMVHHNCIRCGSAENDAPFKPLHTCHCRQSACQSHWQRESILTATAAGRGTTGVGAERRAADGSAPGPAPCSNINSARCAIATAQSLHDFGLSRVISLGKRSSCLLLHSHLPSTHRQAADDASCDRP